MKQALITIDVEEWYHLDYFKKLECDTNITVLDGLDTFYELTQKHDVKANYFFLDVLVEKCTAVIANLKNRGDAIGSHGYDHTRPLQIDEEKYFSEMKESYKLIKAASDQNIVGYRAPCFSLDRRRLEIVKAAGFDFDSSRIDFSSHPLYGSIEMSGYEKLSKFLFRNCNFYEFEVTTMRFWGMALPISGGGYLRILPWILSKYLISRHLRTGQLYVLYIHPYELSSIDVKLPKDSKLIDRVRFNFGRKRTKKKFEKLIRLLRAHGYEFTTFSEIISSDIERLKS